jgi:hypothetical protein
MLREIFLKSPFMRCAVGDSVSAVFEDFITAKIDHHNGGHCVPKLH